MYTTPLIPIKESEFIKDWFSNLTFIRCYGRFGYTCTNKDNASAYVSMKTKQVFAYYIIKHIAGIPNTPTSQAVTERLNQTIKDMLKKQKRMISSI